MWALAVLALLLFAVHAALQSDRAGAYFAGLLENGLEDLLEREVWVGSVHLKLLPLGVEVEELTIGGPRPVDPPLLSIGRVIVDAELLDLQRRVLTIHEVLLEEPRLTLDLFGPGQSNLPKLGKRGGSGEGIRPLLRVNVRHLGVAGGELRLTQHRLPIELDAKALNAELSGGRGEELVGRVVSGAVDLRLPRANPVVAAVGLRIVVGPEGLRILNGRVGAPDLVASVTGRADWPDKEWVFEVQGQGHTRLFEELGYLRGEVAGPFELDGGFAWRERSWGFRARVTSPELQVLGRDMRELASTVSGDRNGVRFDIDRAQYAGGGFGGGVNVVADQDPRVFEVDLSLDGVDLQQLIRDQDIPVEGLAGRVSGVFNYRFPFGQSRRGQGWADLLVTPEQPPRRAAIPLGGPVPLLIEGGVLRTQAARLTGPHERIEVDGYFDLEDRAGEFDYQIDSERIERLALVMPPAADGESPLWMPTSGRGAIDGTLLVRPGDTGSRMRLDLEEVEAPGAAADRVQGTLEIGPAGLEAMRLELLRPGGGLIVTGTAPFASAERGDLPTIPFVISVDAAGWPLAQAQAWLPQPLPVDGPVSGSLSLWGDPEDPIGRLRADVEPATFGRLELQRIELWLDFDSSSARIERLAFQVPAGEVGLTGEVDRIAESLDLELTALGLRMDEPPFAALLPGRVTGRLDVRGRLDGPLDRPRLASTLSWRELAAGGRTLGADGGARLAITLADQRLQAEGDLLGLVSLSGGGRLDTSGFDLRLAVASSALQDLLQLASGNALPSLAGETAGELLLQGSFGESPEWSAAVELDRFSLTYEGLRLESLEPVVATLGADRLQIDSFFVGESDSQSELFLNGSIGLDAARSLSLRLQSSLENRWLDMVLPELGLRSGRFDALATIVGTVEQPALNGQGRLYEGRVVLAELPFALEAIDGVILFEPDQLFVDTLTARAAGGRLLVSGTVRPFDRPDAVDYRIQVSAESLNVPFPENWSTRGDAELVISSTEQGRQIRGSVEVQRAMYVQDVKLGLTQMLQGLLARRRLEVESADELATLTELNIAVRGDGALRVRNNLADLRGDLDLLVRGTVARPAVFGEVELERGGKLVLGPNEYLIERGTLTFANPTKIEPIVDVVARADIREYDITLNLSGTLDRLDASYSSSPPLADLDILSLLATGEESWSGGAATESSSGDQALSASTLLYGQAASLVSQRTGQLFGLDRFRVQPLTSSSGDLSSARVTVGKQLSRDLYVTYSYDPATTAEQVFEIEWRVARGVTLLLRQNGDESYGVDVVLRQNF